MPLPEVQTQACLAAIGELIQNRRPKPEIRHKFDIKAEITGQEVIVSEVRARWNNPQEFITIPVAKARWIGTRQRWILYWKRSDMKWHLYVPGQHLTEIQAIIQEIDEDPWNCFWG